VSTFRALRALRALRLLRAFRMLRETFSPLTKAFLRVGIAIFCALFIFASFYNVVENTQYVTFTGATNAKAPTFGDALYLGIVTIATVGYGDVIPSTWASKLLVVLLVLVAAFIVPIQVDKIGSVIGAQSLFMKPFNAKKRGELPHVIVMCAGRFCTKTVLEFLSQLYHPALQLTNVTRRCVVLGEDDPDEEMGRALMSPLWGSCVQYVRCSPPFSSDDLFTAAAPSAAAIFILINPFLEMHNRGFYDDEGVAPTSVHVKVQTIVDRAALLRVIMCSTTAPETHVFVQLSLQKSLELVEDMLLKDQWKKRTWPGMRCLPHTPPATGALRLSDCKLELFKRRKDNNEVPRIRALTEEAARRELEEKVALDLRALAASPRVGPKASLFTAAIAENWCSAALVQNVLVPGFSVIVSNLVCSHHPPPQLWGQRAAVAARVLARRRGAPHHRAHATRLQGPPLFGARRAGARKVQRLRGTVGLL